MNTIIIILATIAIIIFLVYTYRNREESEPNLGWKIFGYYLLGAFTFRFNDFALPAGFLIFLLFFRPMQNVKAKRYAACAGLAIFILQLIVPAVEKYIYQLPREVAGTSNNIGHIRFTKDWIAIKDHLEIDPNSHLEDFKLEYRRNGQIDRLSYDVVSRSEDGFILHDVAFSPESNEYTIKRRKVGRQWLQFDRTVDTKRFFEVLDQVAVSSLLPIQKYEVNILNSDGEFTSYGIKDRKKYLIQENGLKEITNDKLPVNGYYIASCVRGEIAGTFSGSTRSSGCEAQADYFFDVAK